MTKVTVEYDDLLNELSWGVINFMTRTGSDVGGKTFNDIKPFLKGIIQEWVDVNVNKETQ